jgi:hypothetical protein
MRLLEAGREPHLNWFMSSLRLLFFAIFRNGASAITTTPSVSLASDRKTTGSATMYIAMYPPAAVKAMQHRDDVTL